MPSPFVLPVYWTPVASFAIRISAPTITPPVASSTRPLIVAFGDCPARQPAKTRLTIPRKLTLRNHMLLLLRQTNCFLFVEYPKEKAEMYQCSGMAEQR